MQKSNYQSKQNYFANIICYLQQYAKKADIIHILLKNKLMLMDHTISPK